jgi:hypothetical protein
MVETIKDDGGDESELEIKKRRNMKGKGERESRLS